ncbi:MAG: hypothetical protein M0R06_05245 [Sphaerochaeta sp.]|jgi:hypothetical protein|nr:hypothetical protein [Sphaerochaeta sp.]
MSVVRWDLSRVNDLIHTEGLGFCVEFGIRSQEIEDKRLARLWKRARADLEAIKKFLEEENGSGVQAT